MRASGGASHQRRVGVAVRPRGAEGPSREPGNRGSWVRRMGVVLEGSWCKDSQRTIVMT